MSKTDKESKAILIDYDAQQLAKEVSKHLTPEIKEIVDNIEKKKANEHEKPITMAEACDYLGISSVTFSQLVGKGEINYHSMNLNNPRARKFFYRKDLRAYLDRNRSKTISELKQGK